MALDEVAVFVRVVQSGSFAGAAKNLRMPTSTVCRMVSNLEGRLGTQLLHRSTRSMALTDLGQNYFDEVEGAIDAVRDASDSLKQNESALGYRLKLVASPDIGTEILPDILVPFQQKHPNVFVDVELTVTPPNVSGRKFDLAIWGGKLANSNLVCSTLQNEDLGLFGTPKYFVDKVVPETPDDLKEHRCILMRPEGSTPSWKLLSQTGASTIAPPPTFTANDMAFLRNLILQGGGIGPLPIVMAQRWQREGALQRVLPEFTMSGLPLFLIQPRRSFQTRAVEALKQSIIGWSKGVQVT